MKIKVLHAIRQSDFICDDSTSERETAIAPQITLDGWK